MSVIKPLIRSVVFPAATLLGADRILRNASANQRLILMFHGVTKEDTTWFSPRHLTTEHFEKLIRYVSRHFRIVHLEEMFAPAQPSAKKKIAITFDDGYVNNLMLAAPILKKYEAPATFFISTLAFRKDHLNKLWADILLSAMHHRKNETLIFDQCAFRNGMNAGRVHLFDYVKRMDAKKRDLALVDFCAKNHTDEFFRNIPEEIWRLMTEDEVRKLANSDLVTIGSHGDLHYNLGNITAEEAKRDMLSSKEQLEKITGKKVDSIAFPDGSYSEKVKELAAEIGLKKQIAVDYRLPADINDTHILCRHGVSSTTSAHANIIHINRGFSKRGFP